MQDTLKGSRNYGWITASMSSRGGLVAGALSFVDLIPTPVCDARFEHDSPVHAVADGPSPSAGFATIVRALTRSRVSTLAVDSATRTEFDG